MNLSPFLSIKRLAELSLVFFVLTTACNDSGFFSVANEAAKEAKGRGSGAGGTNVGNGQLDPSVLENLPNAIRMLVSCGWIKTTKELACAASFDGDAPVGLDSVKLGLAAHDGKALASDRYDLTRTLNDDTVNFVITFSREFDAPWQPFLTVNNQKNHWKALLGYDFLAAEGQWDAGVRRVVTLVPANPCDTWEAGTTLCPNDQKVPPKLQAPNCLSDGELSFDPTRSPSISWQATPGEGIAAYELALGTQRGSTDARAWAEAPSQADARLSSLTLVPQKVYFVSVRARGVTGEVSEPSTCDGFIYEDLLTRGLVLNLDAALANGGNRSFDDGCPAEAKTWSDVSPNGFHATLQNFVPPCASTGWRGGRALNTGTPPALTINSEAEHVTVNLDLSIDSFTFATWINVDTFALDLAPIVRLGNVVLAFHGDAPDRGRFATWLDAVDHLTQPIGKGQWQHLATSYDAATGVETVYLNAALQYRKQLNPPLRSFAVKTVLIGSANEPKFRGKIANLLLYNSPLTDSEISKICQAQEHRFTAATNPLCAR